MHLAWPLFMVFVFFDTTQGIAQAAIRASGKQQVGTLITSIAYIAVGIPLAALLCFKYNMGIKGIWAGPTVAVAINTVCYLLIFARLDWDKLIAEAAVKRQQDDKFQAEKQEITSKVDDEDNKYKNS